MDSRKFHLANGSTIVPLVLVVGSLVITWPWILEIPSTLDAFLAALGLGITVFMVALSVVGYFHAILGFGAAWMACWMFMASIYQLSHGVAAWGDNAVIESGGNVTRALLLNVITQVAILIGYGMRSRRVAVKENRSPMSESARPESGRARRARGSSSFSRSSADGVTDGLMQGVNWSSRYLRILALLSVLMLPFVAAQRGGIRALFLPRDLQESYLDNANLGGVVSAVVGIVPFSLSVASVLLGLRLMSVYGWRRLPTLDRVSVGAAMLMTWCYANPIANTRFIALAAFGPMLLMILRPRSTRGGVVWIIGFVLFILFLYPLVAIVSSSLGAEAVRHSSEGYFSVLGSQDFDGFQQTINSFEFVEQHGHTWGKYTLSALFIFIPRSLWASKSTPASIDVAVNHGYSFTNLSLAPNAEMYIEFGWVGVFCVFMIVGWLLAALDEQWLTFGRYVPIAAYSVFAQIGLARGPLGSQVPVILFTFIFLFLGCRLWSRSGLPWVRDLPRREVSGKRGQMRLDSNRDPDSDECPQPILDNVEHVRTPRHG